MGVGVEVDGFTERGIFCFGFEKGGLKRKRPDAFSACGVIPRARNEKVPQDCSENGERMPV